MEKYPGRVDETLKRAPGAHFFCPSLEKVGEKLVGKVCVLKLSKQCECLMSVLQAVCQSDAAF